MYIKCIIIDGFKSYKRRVVIQGFDPRFNAITGLNGSGKSNILDAICFVLGLTSLDKVRARSLHELIYKNGQAEVKSASVTITFVNNEPHKVPMEFSKYSEITVGRHISIQGTRNKYVLNGSTVTQKRISDFFNSIQMNVNNPHFLIMQGTINKVLNMKPAEILSLLEEAAGTRLYKIKKHGALKQMNEKQKKLDMLEILIKEDVLPKIEELKAERKKLQTLQSAQVELDRLKRMVVVVEYIKCKDMTESLAVKRLDFTKDVEETENRIEKVAQEITENEAKIEELQKTLDEDFGGKLSQLKETANEIDKLVCELEKNHRALANDIADEMKTLEQLEREIAKDEKTLKTKKYQMKGIDDEFVKLNEQLNNAKDAYDAATKKQKAINTGLMGSGSDGSSQTLEEELSDLKNKITAYTTEKQTLNAAVKHAKNKLMNSEAKMRKSVGSDSELCKQIACKEKEIQELQTKLGSFNCNRNSISELNAARNKTLAEIHLHERNMRPLTQKNACFNFTYKKPYEDFRDDWVKGPVINFFKCNDPKFHKALDVGGGGKLMMVVVENEHASRDLIKYGCFNYRTTFAPLNRVKGRVLDNSILNEAKKMVGEHNVFLARSLIITQPEYSLLLDWVFGDILVCTTNQGALKLSKDLKVKCVTLDGDLYNAAGTVSGGREAGCRPGLATLSELSNARAILNEKKAEFSKIEEDLLLLDKMIKECDDVKNNVELRTSELNVLKLKLETSQQFQLEKEINDLKEEIKLKTARLVEIDQELVECTSKAESCEYKLKNISMVRGEALKLSKIEVETRQKEFEKIRAKFAPKQKVYDDLKSDLDLIDTAISNNKSLLESTQTKIDHLREKERESNKKLEDKKLELSSANAAIDSVGHAMAEKSTEIQSLINKSQSLDKERAEQMVKKKKIETEMAKSIDDYNAYVRIAERLKRDFSWIEGDEELFGKPGSKYTLNGFNSKEAHTRIKNLEKIVDDLSRGLNPKVAQMFNKEDEGLEKLVNEREEVFQNRSQIEKCVEILDGKMMALLTLAREEVNKDFGSIVAMLIKTSSASLQLYKESIFDGLQFLVRLGNSTKNLSELSGGQRSLIALSFILAMMRFRPAPIYILDEVDAPLDLSHTQNIGSMLRQHFTNAQFIVVSLKQGMFQNANVLFKTRFVDGMSNVERTVSSDDQNNK